MQSQDDPSGSAVGGVAASPAAQPLPKHELLYHETKWLVLKLLSCSPSTAESPAAVSTSSARFLRTGHGNVSPRTLQTGVSLRLAGTMGNDTAMCYDLEIDGDATEEPAFDIHDGPSSAGDQRRRQRASLTLDVRSAAAGDGNALEQSALQQVMEEEVCVELNRLTDELRDSHVDINSSPILTPQTEVANVLRVLGDKMNEAFTMQLEIIADDVVDMGNCSRTSSESPPLAYEAFERGARQLIGEGMSPVSTGWNSVALVLAYGQHVAWNLLKKGHKSLGDVADYTTRVLWDHAAGFIVREGGWSAMSPVPSMASYLLDASTAPVPATMDAVDGATSAQPASAVRGTTINQMDGYIRLTRDQGVADCARLPKGQAAADTAPATASRGQGADISVNVKSSLDEDDNGSPLDGTGHSQSSSAAATLSSEMSIPIFSRSCSMEETSASGIGDAYHHVFQSPPEFGCTYFSDGDDNAAVTATAAGYSASNDRLCCQYASVLQEAQSDESLSEQSGSSPMTCRVPEHRWPQRQAPLSASLPRLAPSPFGSVRDIRLSSFDGHGDSDAVGNLWLSELSPSAFGSMRDLHGCGITGVELAMASIEPPAGAAVSRHGGRFEVADVSIADLGHQLSFTSPEPCRVARARSVPVSPAAVSGNQGVKTAGAAAAAVDTFNSLPSLCSRSTRTKSTLPLMGLPSTGGGNGNCSSSSDINRTVLDSSRRSLRFESVPSGPGVKLDKSDMTNHRNVTEATGPRGPTNPPDVRSVSTVLGSSRGRRSMDILMRTDLPRKRAGPLASAPSVTAGSVTTLSSASSSELPCFPPLSSVQNDSCAARVRPAPLQADSSASMYCDRAARTWLEPSPMLPACTDETRGEHLHADEAERIGIQLVDAHDTGIQPAAGDSGAQHEVASVSEDCAVVLQIFAPVTSCGQAEDEGQHASSTHGDENILIVNRAALGQFECACGCPPMSSSASSDSEEVSAFLPLHAPGSATYSVASATRTSIDSGAVSSVCGQQLPNASSAAGSVVHCRPAPTGDSCWNTGSTDGGSGDSNSGDRCIKRLSGCSSINSGRSSPAAHHQQLPCTSIIPVSGMADNQLQPLGHCLMHCCATVKDQLADIDWVNGSAILESDASIDGTDNRQCQVSPDPQPNVSVMAAAAPAGTTSSSACDSPKYGWPSGSTTANDATAEELVTTSVGATELRSAKTLGEAVACCTEADFEAAPIGSSVMSYDTSVPLEPLVTAFSQGLHSPTVESEASEQHLLLDMPALPASGHAARADATETVLIGRRPFNGASMSTPACSVAALQLPPAGHSCAAPSSEWPTHGHALRDAQTVALASDSGSILADAACSPAAANVVPVKTKLSDDSGRYATPTASELVQSPLVATTVLQQQQQQFGTNRWPAIVGGLVLVVAVVYVAVRSRSQLLKGHPY